MSLPAETSEDLCAIYVDMGTTNTRAWLMVGNRLIARESAAVGVRDSARNKSANVIRQGLHDLVGRLRRVDSDCEPLYMAAAGMISSSLGLSEVPHAAAPAGLNELSVAAQWHQFKDISDLPILLIPGVRCGLSRSEISQVHNVDVMRGEETLCAGLTALNLISCPGVVLNLGSHWKAIRLDDEGRVCSSVTSLSGEMIHATQQNTILADSVAASWPDELSREWLTLGMDFARQSGLPRALFSTRLLDLSHQGTAEDRLAVVIGAFIAVELDALRRRDVFNVPNEVGIIGHKALAEAWQFALCDAGIPAAIIDSAAVENAFLTALRLILEKARHSLDCRSAHNIGRTLSS